MRRLNLLVLGLIVVAACSPQPAEESPAAGANVTFFEGARLISGDGGTPIEESAFIVEDGEFTRIGRKGELLAPDRAARVDLAGTTVMPALVAIHTHLGYAKDATFSAENYTRETILDQLNRFAYYGVGAVLSLGLDTGDLAVQLRDERRTGKIDGALFRSAGRGFAAVNGGPTLTFRNTQPLRHVPYEVDSPDEARKHVQDMAARKVDMVKIWVDDRAGTVPKLRPGVSKGRELDRASLRMRWTGAASN